MNWMKLRYQSKVIGGRPVSGILTMFVQEPLSASPVTIHAGLFSLPHPDGNHWYARKSRASRASTAAQPVVPNSQRASGGSWISTARLSLSAISVYLLIQEYGHVRLPRR